MKKRLLLLGASGNLGLQTIDVVDQLHDQFEIVGMSVGNRTQILRDYLKEHKLACACVKNKEDYDYFVKEYPEVKFYWGNNGLLELTAYTECDLIVNNIIGFAGLLPTINSLKHKKNVALANKESLVVAGRYLMNLAKENGVEIIPIDSEHSAIYQCLKGSRHEDIRRLIITASGGAFRNLTRDQLKDVTLAQALAHPNWNMGKMITIDSATMMNKGFEVIEARWLFDVDFDHIDVIQHRESVIASMVEFKDHAVLAQMGVSDMREHIQYALETPLRSANNSKSLDLAQIGTLHFEKMDYERFPFLALAYEVGRKDGNLPTIMNGANEAAVNLFLQEQIRFTDIEDLVFKTIEDCTFIAEPTIDQLVEADKWANEHVLSLARKL